MLVPPGALALGIPARIFEGRSDRMNRFSAAEYVANGKRYKATMRRLDWTFLAWAPGPPQPAPE